MIIDWPQPLAPIDVLFARRFSLRAALVAMTGEGGPLGVDRWIVFPFVMNLSLKIEAMRRGEIVSGGLEKVPYAFENRRLLREIYELFPDEGKRCLPFAMLDPMREQAGQIAELQRLRGDYDFTAENPDHDQSVVIKTLVRRARLRRVRRGMDIPFIIHSSVGDDDPWAQASDILDIVENFRTCASASRTRAVTTRNASTACRAAQRVVRLRGALHPLRRRVADMPFIVGGRDASSRISPIRARHRGPRSGVSTKFIVGQRFALYSLRGDARRRTPRAESAGVRRSRGVAGAASRGRRTVANTTSARG